MLFGRLRASIQAWALVSGLVAGCGGDAGEPGAPGTPAVSESGAPRDLVDEARVRGLDYVDRSGEPQKRTILEANGPGVAVIDLGDDGDLDLVFAQGCASLSELLRGPGADLEMFENDGAGRFSRAKGPGLSGWWTGLAAGDVDGDGDQDLVAGGFGQLRVLLQDASGALVPGADLIPPGSPGRLDPGAPREKGTPPRWVTSLALFDADGDGHLDLYAGHYLDLDPVDPPLGRVGEGPLAVPCRWKGYEVFCGPHGTKPQPDRFYRGSGDGTFADASETALRGHVPGYTLAVAPFDFEGDGDADVYVANDSTANLLLINDGRGVFTDVAYSANVALSSDGRAEAGMGIAFGDVDRDGDLDFALTNFSGESTAMYFASKRGFSNETFRFGLQRETRALLSWGCHLVDFDGDGALELFTGTGHVYPQADLENTGTSYLQQDRLWRLRAAGEERSLERVEPCGPESVLAAPSGTRGTAVGDFDGDGAPDLVLARIDGPAALAMNRFPRRERLVVRCLGPLGSEAQPGATRGRTPADAMGARVVLVPEAAAGARPVALLDQVQTAVGYQSSSTPWLHFGLGEAERYSSLTVTWPSGRVEELGPGASGRRITVREGQGIVAEEQLP